MGQDGKPSVICYCDEINGGHHDEICKRIASLRAENEKLKQVLLSAILIIEGTPVLDPFAFPDYAREALRGGK